MSYGIVFKRHASNRKVVGSNSKWWSGFIASYLWISVLWDLWNASIIIEGLSLCTVNSVVQNINVYSKS